jgi:hypothetical protein
VTSDDEGYLAMIDREVNPDPLCLEIRSLEISTTQNLEKHTRYQEMIVKLDIEEPVLCPVNTSVQNHDSPGKKLNGNKPTTNVTDDSASYYIKINGSGTGSNPCTDGTFPHRIQLRVRNRYHAGVFPMSAQPAHLTKKRKSNSEVSIAADWRPVKSKTLGEERSVHSLVPFVERQLAVLYAHLQTPDNHSQTYYVRVGGKRDKVVDICIIVDCKLT